MTTYLGNGLRWRYRIKYLIDPREYYREIKMYWDRARRGWSEPDTWSADSYLARMLADMLEYLQDDCHSYPSHLEYEDWLDILAVMHYGFDRYANRWDIWEDTVERTIAKEREIFTDLEVSLELFKEHFMSLWD